MFSPWRSPAMFGLSQAQSVWFVSRMAIGFILLLSLAACGGEDTGTTDDGSSEFSDGSGFSESSSDSAADSEGSGGEARNGHFTGRMVNQFGEPIILPGVQPVATIGCETGGNYPHFEVTPDASGFFDIELGLEIGRCTPDLGRVELTFEGQQYTLPLDPVGGYAGQGDVNAAHVQNYVWLLTGEQSDGTGGTYGGEVVVVFEGYPATSLPTETPIQIVFEPLTGFPDGSVAQPVVIDTTLNDIRSRAPLTVAELPLARWRATATAFNADGSGTPLLFESPTGEYIDTFQEFLFSPESASLGGVGNQYLYIWSP